MSKPEFVLRETIEFTTPYTKKPVVMRGYFSGAQLEEIEEALTVDADRDGETLSFKLTAMKAAGAKAMELALISVDEKTEGLLELVRNLPGPDYRYIVQRVKGVRDSSDIVPKD
ncbi:hypothetical protein QF038_001853 [Pseudarthrobacter sp. W1I19]|uniref:hypothetical protein n=1 Tax=Pseudarthrobacter sp. W1I19 TaxID=3042288 RepID=UPI002787CC8B|nr:hypothetical protein [Pseudarthrobacter sp. W1I19]MDQ0923345.1 hypothetical protein [Pseudarthrobacter sp. W1I19]